jgi:uncharacterized protein YcbK (DUF882 family)
VPTGFARHFNALSFSKAGCQLGLASLLLVMGGGAVHDATAENERRTLTFHHTHSDENLTVTFKRDGRYDEAALKQLNHYLRDWRTQDETVMDRHLFDIIWEVYRDVDGKQPIQIISSYRSPATNAMLRRRSANSGVARFSQHMLGHAMDFYIPGVPLEQIRFAGLRLQRGGVGFYPTSGSPFVHLDTGSIRMWPRMTHDQLAKVFPDGRTVHLPTDGMPLKGYELAKADIEKRAGSDQESTINKPGNFLASLFGRKSHSDEDDEAGSAPAADEKAAAPAQVAAVAKPDVVPMPRAKPQVTATLQLAAADTRDVPPPKAKPQVLADKAEAAAEPQTMSDIINARGFWGDNPSTPKQATPAQVMAAISARQAQDTADRQPTASVPAVYQAMAYAPASAPATERANVVAASAPVPRISRPATASRSSAVPATEINTIAIKTTQDQDDPIANATRLSAGKSDGLWMRIMMLAPSVSTMSVTILGDSDMTGMRAYFVKPAASIAMGFSNDPMMGLDCDHFSGSSLTRLEMTSFTLRTALLR